MRDPELYEDVDPLQYQWENGWKKCMQGESIHSCKTQVEKRGWWLANETKQRPESERENGRQ